VSVHFEAARNRWVVRWREDGRNRSRRFERLEAAEAFDAAVRRPAETAVAPPPTAPHGDGIYPYRTRSGVRLRDHRRHRHVRRGDGNAARALDAQGDTLTITLGAGA
jgi:hypothetical protein